MPRTKYGQAYHHCNRSGSDRCANCQQTRMMYWRDKEERNGWGETFRWVKGAKVKGDVCESCFEIFNGGRPPLGLRDLEEMRRTGETTDQYYKRHGL